MLDSAAETLTSCDAVHVCLASVPAGESVLLTRPDGLLVSDLALDAKARRATVVVDHGTVPVLFTQRCHAAAKKAGLAFVDAPISGGPEGAKNGTLAIMVCPSPRTLVWFATWWLTLHCAPSPIVRLAPRARMCTRH